MKILFVADNFPPEVSPPASRTFAHCKEWVAVGEEVTVIASVPNFPAGRVFAGYRNKLFQRERIAGIDLIRVWSLITPNEGFITRIADFLSFAASSFFAGLFQRGDIIMTTSPQFFVGLSARALAFVKRRPWIFEVRDLWPESIAAVGMMRKTSLAYRFLEAIELHFYRSASAVIVVSEAFRKNLTDRGIPSEKIFTIPNGSELDDFVAQPRDAALAARLGVEGKFVLGFIGTHGLAHGLDFILDCAPALAAENIHVLLVGDGAKKADLVARVANEKIANVSFSDPIPRNQVPALMALCDAALVNLKASTTFLSVIPSKMFEAAALGCPILLGVDGIAREMVEQYQAGLYYTPEDRDAFIAAAKRLKDDKVLYAKLQDGCRAMAKAYDRKAMAAQALEVLRRFARKT